MKYPMQNRRFNYRRLNASIHSILSKAVSNSALQEFEYSVYNKVLGERIVYDGHYSTGTVNIGIIISAIIMIAVVFMTHMIEKEKRYLTLTAARKR